MAVQFAKILRFFLIYTFVYLIVITLFYVNSANAQFDLELDTKSQETIETETNHGPKIRINIPARKLYLYDGDQLVKSYSIAVGQNRYKTPVGNRIMKKIIWNPWWIPPSSPWAQGSNPTPPGPRNPLGPVKMDLGNAILVHGTNKEYTVGTAASHGCMRMKNKEAIELARYIQENYTSKNNPELFDQYAKKRWKSFYVPLTNPIPVEVVYDVVDLQNDTLNVYSDVYYRIPWHKKKKLVADEIAKQGYRLEDYNTDSLFEKIRKAKNKDTNFNLSEFSKTLQANQNDLDDSQSQKDASVNDNFAKIKR